MRLVLVRHGETEENTQHRLTSILPGKLTSRGIEQAQQLAQELSSDHFDVIYTSDLERAKKTAEIIAVGHANTPFIVTQALRERDVGEHVGKLHSEVPLDRPRNVVNITHVLCKEGESLNALYNRIKTFLEELRRKHKNQTVLVVTHNGVMRALFSIVEGKSAKEIVEYGVVENATPYVLELD